MKYLVKEKEIHVVIPAANFRKFRFKKRDSRLDFGNTFSTRKIPFDRNTYLEWQIGYDVPIKDVKAGKAKTKLNKEYFVGSNGKQKYPYELSELVYEATGLGLISKKELKNVLDEIKGYKDFIDKKVPSVEYHSKVTINGISFEEASIKLPTLFMIETIDGTQIEVATQKQQYATGIQPMVYFCIPLEAFSDSSKLSSRSSVSGDVLTYVINEDNAKNLISMLKIFGMISKRHNHDMIQIIGILLK